MFNLGNKRHRYSVFKVSCKDGRGLSMDITADFSYRFSDSWQTHIRLSSATHVWVLTGGAQQQDCWGPKTQLRLIFLFLEDKERNMCRFYLRNVCCWARGCNKLPSLMSIVAHENGQRIDYHKRHFDLNVRGL